MKLRLLVIVLLLPLVAFAGRGLWRQGDDQSGAIQGVYQVGETVYVAAEPLLSTLGARTCWNTASQRLTVTMAGKVGAVTLFSEWALVDGQLVSLGAPPRFLEGRFCLPVSFFDLAWPKLSGSELQLTSLEPSAPQRVAFVPYREALQPRAVKRREMAALHRIVLDAGHGGHDPGAISPQGIREKDVNLAITLKLAQKLRQNTDAQVVLTRHRDIFISLAERARIANRVQADAFLSIHANGAYNRRATGFEVYFLSARASDARAAALAKFENSDLAIGGDFENLPSSEDDLATILRDMIRTENLAASERLAVAIQSRLDIAMHIENRGVKQAPFYVLLGTQMPAVLIEVGFLSNPREAELLNSAAVQDLIVSALYQAILYYDSVRAAAGPAPAQ